MDIIGIATAQFEKFDNLIKYLQKRLDIGVLIEYKLYGEKHQ